MKDLMLIELSMSFFFLLLVNDQNAVILVSNLVVTSSRLQKWPQNMFDALAKFET